MRHSWRLVLFALAALLLAVSIMYSRVARRVYLGEALRFVPKESEIVVVTGEIGTLWEAVDRHFGEVIRSRGDDESGGLAQLLTTWREEFEERGVPVRGLADLEHHGIDVSRGLIASVDNPYTESGPLAIIGVADPDAFADFFAALFDADLQARIPLPGTDTHVIGGEDAVLAFPEPGTAMVQFEPDDPLTLQRSLSETRQNLIHARENDAFYDGVRHSLGRPLGTGPALYLYWQPRSLPPLQEIVAVARLGDRAIEIDADFEIEGGGLRTLDDLETPAEIAVPWTRHLPSTTAAAVFLVDVAASEYLSIAALSDELEAAMERGYGGILGELRRVSTLERLLFAWTGYRNGLPEWVLGVWADREELDDLVDELQVRRREERDRVVLAAAIEAYREEVGETASPTLAQLTTSGLLLPEPLDLLDRYPIVEGIVVPAGVSAGEVEEAIGIYRGRVEQKGPPTLEELRADGLLAADPGPAPAVLTAADLDHPTYRQTFEGLTLEYLLPSVTENDLRYVPELADEDAGIVRQDRYRLTALVLNDILWIASDSRELEDLVVRHRGRLPGLADSVAFATAETTWHGREKIRGFIDVDRLTTLGLLSPESRIEEQVKTTLLDLRNHPVVAFELDPCGAEDCVSLNIRLFHRSAMVSR